MMEERLRKQIDFILEIDKIKQIFRQTYISDGKRKENDAEHSWHLAVMCMLLSEYANEKIDVMKTMSMVLIHDIVEVYAGDTYAYDEVGKTSQKKREVESADKIFNILPDDQAKYMRDLWNEFEDKKSPEAKFARTLDNIQPLLLSDFTNGRSWREHDVHISQIMNRNKITPDGSNQLWQYCSKLLDKNIEDGNIRTN